MKIIAGLGNPGSEYAATKHNVGFMLVDALADKLGIDNWQDKFDAKVAQGFLGTEKILLVKPLTYMNESGRAIGPLMNFYKLETEDLIVVHDDMDIPAGTVRIRKKGSAGGHNGIKSVLAHLGDEHFARVRIGIGRPLPGWTVVNHVLAPFTDEDKPKIREAIDYLPRSRRKRRLLKQQKCRKEARKMPQNELITAVYADEDGNILDAPGMQGMGRTGRENILLKPEDLIPLPESADLMLLPDHLAVGMASDGEVMPISGLAVAAILPAGYTRLYMPAYERAEEAERLPLYGYTAVVVYKDVPRRICRATVLWSRLQAAHLNGTAVRRRTFSTAAGNAAFRLRLSAMPTALAVSLCSPQNAARRRSSALTSVRRRKKLPKSACTICRWLPMASSVSVRAVKASRVWRQTILLRALS